MAAAYTLASVPLGALWRLFGRDWAVVRRSVHAEADELDVVLLDPASGRTGSARLPYQQLPREAALSVDGPSVPVHTGGWAGYASEDLMLHVAEIGGQMWTAAAVEPESEDRWRVRLIPQREALDVTVWFERAQHSSTEGSREDAMRRYRAHLVQATECAFLNLPAAPSAPT